VDCLPYRSLRSLKKYIFFVIRGKRQAWRLYYFLKKEIRAVFMLNSDHLRFLLLGDIKYLISVGQSFILVII